MLLNLAQEELAGIVNKEARMKVSSSHSWKMMLAKHKMTEKQRAHAKSILMEAQQSASPYLYLLQMTCCLFISINVPLSSHSQIQSLCCVTFPHCGQD